MDYERSDLVSDVPENCQYQDAGCELADSCLNCPFQYCVFESWGGKWRLKKARRNKEIINKAERGFTVRELAATYHISRRTVQRVLKKKKGGLLLPVLQQTDSNKIIR